MSEQKDNISLHSLFSSPFLNFTEDFENNMSSDEEFIVLVMILKNMIVFYQNFMTLLQMNIAILIQITQIVVMKLKQN